MSVLVVQGGSGVVIERVEGGDDVLGAIAAAIATAAVAADCVGAIAG